VKIGKAVAASLLLAGTSGLALAQSAAMPGGAGLADEAGPRGEIIVTGLKFDRTLQETPASVEVYTAEDIERQNLIDVYDAIDRTANVSSNFNNSGFTIRGISNSNVSGTGLGDLATVYLDGSPLPREAVNGGPLDLWDVEQVEILRGPQSTLQGRNALAGAVIVNTADPSFEWRGKARAMLTDATSEYRFAAAIGGPIVDDVLAFRVAGEVTDGEGLIKNKLTGGNYSPSHSEVVRSKLLFAPSGPDGLQVMASYLYDRHFGNQGRGYVYTDVPDFWDDRYVTANRDTFTRTKTDLFALDANLPLGEALSLQSITTYNLLETFSTYDGDLGPEDRAFGQFSTDQKIFSEEIRLTLDAGPLQGLIGAYSSRQKNPDYQADSTFAIDIDRDLALTARVAEFLVGAGFDAPTAQATAQAVRGVYPGKVNISSVQRYPFDIETMALFGDGTLELSPGLKLHAGFRYDRERQKVANINTVTLNTHIPNPADYAANPTFAFILQTVNDLLLQDVNDANSAGPETKTTYEAFLPKGGISFDFAPDKTISAIVQRGYRSGGSGINPGRAQVFAYDPEFTWNYELSLRTQWLDRRLTLNANAFYIDWSDQQVLVYLSSNRYDYETQNAGKSRVYGVEVEGSFDVTPELNVYGSVGYANSKFLDFTVENGTTQNLSGFSFAQAPKWTAAGGIDWLSQSGLSANVNVNYRGAQYQFVDRQDERDVPGRTLVNAKIGWRNANFGAFVVATNLFDEQFYDYQYVNEGRLQALLGEPRQFSVVFEGRF